ncbi:hypothetical protein ACJIZ3_003127 [Penstemon smallii]|uniref:Uncharacterized protein n=1 Tax=Penstemon smallii TaxID=265156 RepID=A0ABD3U8C6_9LAMI
MEELFQYMKTLRSQINDVADQAAKVSVEEHMHSTTIQTLQKDLDLVKNEIRQVKDETDQMAKAKGQICSQILEKQKKFASLESDSSTLTQTLKLMQQERLILSAKLEEKCAYYTKVAEDISGQLKEQQELINSQKFSSHIRESLVSENADGTEELQEDVDQSMMINFEAAKGKFDQIAQERSNLVLENIKLRQSVEQVKSKISDFKPELREMDEKSLEEELQALISDKAGETEYVQSLQLQTLKLKEISHNIKCSCGEEYNVKLQ